MFNAKTGRNLKNRHKDGGSPDARLRLALLRSARLRLNDGAKLWVFLQTLLQNKYFLMHILEKYIVKG